VYVWLAAFVTLMAVCLRIVKPLHFAPIVGWLMSITTVYLWVWALSYACYPRFRQGTLGYSVVNISSLALLTVYVTAWGVILPRALRRPQAV
jgi:hypothetical protein